MAYDLWVGGSLATQQDMFALFWARGAERYLKPRGRLAFVLPYAVLNAPVFAGLRAGVMGEARVRLTGAWSLEKVWPIFGGAVGEQHDEHLRVCSGCGGRLRRILGRWIAGSGRLPRRDANEAEAARTL